jgi:hypothetical protein
MKRYQDRKRRILETPWGPAQIVTALLPGQVFSVTTAGHGGIYVTGAALDRIPAEWRAATWTKSPNWYEEDCDWAIVARFLPELFPNSQDDAERTLKSSHAALYARHFGKHDGT